MTDSQHTPISVIIQLYQREYGAPLNIDGLNDMDITTQLRFLDPDQCDSCQYRSDIIKKFKNRDLSTNVFKAIRLKSILSEYHKHWIRINSKHIHMIQNWNAKDFTLSIIVHCIKNDNTESNEKKLATTWKFLSYLVQFFENPQFNGQQFILKHILSQKEKQNESIKTKPKGGFALAIVKQICEKFQQKNGKYTKVKQQLIKWGKITIQRYHEEIERNEIEMNDNEELKNDVDVDMKQSEFKSGSLQTLHPQQPQSNILPSTNGINGSNGTNGTYKPSQHSNMKWYWYCDEGDIRWIPYKDNDQQLIKDAWMNNKENVIIMERFKIDFKREQSGTPAGQQYNYQVASSWRRPVIYGEPDNQGCLKDIPCEKLPR